MLSFTQKWESESLFFGFNTVSNVSSFRGECVASTSKGTESSLSSAWTGYHTEKGASMCLRNVRKTVITRCEKKILSPKQPPWKSENL